MLNPENVDLDCAIQFNNPLPPFKVSQFYVRKASSQKKEGDYRAPSATYNLSITWII